MEVTSWKKLVTSCGSAEAAVGHHFIITPCGQPEGFVGGGGQQLWLPALRVICLVAVVAVSPRVGVGVGGSPTEAWLYCRRLTLRTHEQRTWCCGKSDRGQCTQAGATDRQDSDLKSSWECYPKDDTLRQACGGGWGLGCVPQTLYTLRCSLDTK